MNVLLENIPKVSAVSILALLITVFKLSVNHWNMRGVERFLHVNSRLFSIHASNVIIFSVVSSIAFDVYMMLSNTTNFNTIQELIKFSLTSLVIMTFLISVVYIVIYILMYLLSVRVRFYIELPKEDRDTEDKQQDKEKKKEKWYVVRRINKDYLLLENERIEYQIIDANNLNEKIYISELVQINAKYLHFQKWIYNHILAVSVILCVLIVIFGILASIYPSGKLFALFISLLFLTIAAVSSIFMILDNRRVIRKINSALLEERTK